MSQDAWPTFEVSHRDPLSRVYHEAKHSQKLQLDVYLDMPINMSLISEFKRLEQLKVILHAHWSHFHFEPIASHPTIAHLHVRPYLGHITDRVWVEYAKLLRDNPALRTLNFHIRKKPIAVPFITHVLGSKSIVVLACGKPAFYLTDENFQAIRQNRTLQRINFYVGSGHNNQMHGIVPIPTSLSEKDNAFLALLGQNPRKLSIPRQVLLRRWQIINNHLRRNQLRIFYYVWQMSPFNHPLRNSLFDVFPLIGRFLNISLTHQEAHALKYR